MHEEGPRLRRQQLLLVRAPVPAIRKESERQRRLGLVHDYPLTDAWDQQRREGLHNDFPLTERMEQRRRAGIPEYWDWSESESEEEEDDDEEEEDDDDDDDEEEADESPASAFFARVDWATEAS